jgi:hypothetical protein
MSCRATYGDKFLPSPPIFDKDNNPLVLTQEIPRYHPVKVKFEIEKSKKILEKEQPTRQQMKTMGGVKPK